MIQKYWCSFNVALAPRHIALMIVCLCTPLRLQIYLRLQLFYGLINLHQLEAHPFFKFWYNSSNEQIRSGNESSARHSPPIGNSQQFKIRTGCVHHNFAYRAFENP